jgi:hypothetical protein
MYDMYDMYEMTKEQKIFLRLPPPRAHQTQEAECSIEDQASDKHGNE